MTVDSFSFSRLTEKFEETLRNDLKSWEEDDLALKQACAYALLNGGKRLRPLIVYLTAYSIDPLANVDPAALSIEYFHAASLIVDDLPCMDNDDIRREKPSLHKAYGEATALLASYALMTAGFEKIYDNSQLFKGYEKNQRALIALKEAAISSGLKGATGGQFLDLFFKRPSFSTLESIIEKKTVKLFEIAFLYGWLFGGGSLLLLKEIKSLAYHFGMAFQIADDLHDIEKDARKQNPINMAIFLGEKKARELLEEHLLCFEKQVTVLKLNTAEFLALKEKVRCYAH